MAQIFAAILVVTTLVAFWAMNKMRINGIKAGDIKAGDIEAVDITGIIPQSVWSASYNSRNRWIFLMCVVVGSVATIVFNVLLYLGYASPRVF
jgi:hypothetical protein